MNKNMTENELLEKLASLPREIAPEHDVWSSISARLDSTDARPTLQKMSNSGWKWAAAASVVVAFAAGFLLGNQNLGIPEQPALDSSGASQLAHRGGLSATLAATELEYQAAFREFVSVGSSRDSLTPRTMERLTKSWADLRETEAGLTIALQDNPGNQFLNSKMLELRSRQLDFLQQIAALDQGSRRTTI